MVERGGCSGGYCTLVTCLVALPSSTCLVVAPNSKVLIVSAMFSSNGLTFTNMHACK